MVFRKHRYLTTYPASLVTAAGELRVRLVDINETGARIRGVTGPARGDKVTLVTPLCRASATVQWASGSMLGIAFRPQLPLATVDALRYSRSASRRTTKNYFGLREM